MKDEIILILILIILIFANYLITEFKFLIIMLKIKSCERLCKKARKEFKAFYGANMKGKEE